MIILLVLQIFFNNLTREINYQMSDPKIKQFLTKIKQVESSGGINTNHPVIKSGIQAGDRAAGSYGLMPNTVHEIINRMRIHGTLTPELKQLNNLDPNTLKNTIEKNPNLEEQLAEHLAQRVLDRQQDEEKAAFSWNQGHNLTPEEIEKRDYKNSDYVKKFNKVKSDEEE